MSRDTVGTSAHATVPERKITSMTIEFGLDQSEPVFQPSGLGRLTQESPTEMSEDILDSLSLLGRGCAANDLTQQAIHLSF